MDWGEERMAKEKGGGKGELAGKGEGEEGEWERTWEGEDGRQGRMRKIAVRGYWWRGVEREEIQLGVGEGGTRD